ncbi:2',5'-phosphodiesterase 12 [Auxenochlorella protothecoides]|uniref:Threonylcarbamoyl-AMP synthase n=1 Tax=Auxenochlorella protothecoides TaxID=3075 RepID=A0A087SDF0_AUXPR|nr:2',5'-phosphodiesterase 12 [Auxenochlorella protothecoides]KFM23754.1 2',5'-phosphodiesterase 12 [Auxenochlorella protothecoides]
MTISLTVGGVQRHLQRPKEELLEKPLARLLANLSAPGKGKKHKGRSQQATDLSSAQPASASVAVLAGLTQPSLDASSVTNEAAWVTGHVLQLGEARLPILRNPPLIAKLDVYGDAFVGIPLVPVPQLLFADEDACSWEWEVQRPPASVWTRVGGDPACSAGRGVQRTYIPTPEDVGALVRVCIPPARLEATVPPRLRVVSYNILADQYAATERAKSVLFGHCPEKYLRPTHRRPLILGQLLEFQADILCLQEVDESAFRGLLEPGLRDAGYNGVYTNKLGKVAEGEAAFFRSDRYELAARRDVDFRAAFLARREADGPEDAAGSMAARSPLSERYGPALAAFLEAHPSLREALQRVGTVAQLLLLRPRDPRHAPLCLVNTHLFFHNDAPHIRTLHTWAAVKEACAFLQESANLVKDCELEPTLLFCGDMNSDLNDGIPGALQLLETGQLGADYWDWEAGVDFDWHRTGKNKGNSGDEIGEEDEGEPKGGPAPLPEAAVVRPDPAACGLDLSLAWPRPLRPAGDLQAPFSNYVSGYQGLLDYVFFSGEATNRKYPATMHGALISGFACAANVHACAQRLALGLATCSPPLKEEEAVGKPAPPHSVPVPYDPAALECVDVMPTPSAAELGSFLPSRSLPSDHLPVVFDLSFLPSRARASGSQGPRVDGGASPESPRCVSTQGPPPTSAGGVRPAALHAVRAAAAALAGGGVVALPTDTLYGLAASARDEGGVARLYAVKGRRHAKPVAIALADTRALPRYVTAAHLPPGLVGALLPGPVTLLLERRADAPLAPGLNRGTASLGVRIPDSAFVRAVARQLGGALALTSANASGQTSSVAVTEFQQLWPQCEAVYDDGVLGTDRTGSTVVDLTRPGTFSIIRRGAGVEAVCDTLRAFQLVEGVADE